MSDSYDVAILGGGPAGTAAAITAVRRGRRTLLLERGRYPRHKVCGEFLSAESLGLLRGLLEGPSGGELLDRAPRIRSTRLFVDGQRVRAAIEPAAASIPRLMLDAALWKAAESAGAECLQGCAAREVARDGRLFRIRTDRGVYLANTVIDAAGRWSNLHPAPIAANDTLVGVKAHFAAGQTELSVDLYFSETGYCGVQPVGDGIVNVCAMLRADAVRRSSDLMTAVLTMHKQLLAASAAWRQVSDTVTTAPLIFQTPCPVRDGMLCAGDAAGFIDPFLGDGISLALQTGTLAAQMAEQPDQYQRVYEHRFAVLFRRAERMRRVLSGSELVRRIVLWAVRIPPIGRALVHATRPGADQAFPAR